MKNDGEEKTLHFRRVGWRDTLKVNRISRQLMPKDFHRSHKKLFALYINFERKDRNMCYGIYHGNNMVGHMIIYALDRSLYLKDNTATAFIEEYAVLPEYRGLAKKVIAELPKQMLIYLPGEGIEAIAMGDALSHWLGIGRIVKFFDYDGETRIEENKIHGHEMTRLRWSPNEKNPGGFGRALKLPTASSLCQIGGENYHVSRLSNMRQALSLESIWRQMSLRYPKDLSRSYDYLCSWWKYFGLSEELSILIAKKDDIVVAICPLSICFNNDDNSNKKLHFIGASNRHPQMACLAGDDDVSYVTIFQQYLGEHPELGKSSHLTFSEQPSVNCVHAGKPLSHPERQHWFGLNTTNASLHQRFITDANNIFKSV